MESSPSKTISGSSASPSSSEVTLAKPQYIYYRLFSPAGAVKVKIPEFPDDPFLGRTLAHQLAPPRNIFSLKHHICDLENITNHTQAKLFKSAFETSPLQDKERVDLNSGNASWIGCTPETAVSCVAPDPGPRYKLKAIDSKKTEKKDCLSFEKGDILYTDGVPVKIFNERGYWSYGFRATDRCERSGLVLQTYSKDATHLIFVGQSPTLPKQYDLNKLYEM